MELFSFKIKGGRGNSTLGYPGFEFSLFMGGGDDTGVGPTFHFGVMADGGPLCGASPPHPRGFWGDTDCLEGSTSQFFGRVLPNPAPGTMASAPGMGVAHRGGEAVTPQQVWG